MRWEIGLRDEWEKLFIAGDADAGDKLADFDRAAYEVRVTRTSRDWTTTLVMNEIAFAYVTEITREGFTYPGTCLLAIQAMPSAGLTGQSLRVSCVARRAP